FFLERARVSVLRGGDRGRGSQRQAADLERRARVRPHLGAGPVAVRALRVARGGSAAARALRRERRELLPAGCRVPPLGERRRDAAQRRRERAAGPAHDRRRVSLGARERRAGPGRRMKREIPETPRLLLGTESLLGYTRAARDRLLQVNARFAEPESLAVTFSKAMQLGADGVLASPTRVLGEALAELRHTVPVFALLPNVPEYVRDSSEHGLAGTAL